MKKIILLMSCLLLASVSHAQVVETGAGYFTDLFGAFVKNLGASKDNRPAMPGLIAWGEFGFNLKRNTTLSLFVGNGTIKHGYQSMSGLFSGGKVSDTYFFVDVNFKKNIYFGKNKKRWGIAPGLGIFFRNLETTVPQADVSRDENGNLIINRLYMYSSKDQEIGLSANLDLKYRFKLLYAGIRTKTFITVDYGIGGTLVTPFVGINLDRLNQNMQKQNSYYRHCQKKSLK